MEERTLASIAVPVLAMYGAGSFPGLTEAAQAIADVVPRAEARQAPGAMHMWEPQSMFETLATFVRRLAGAR